MQTFQEVMTDTDTREYTITRLDENNLDDLAWLHLEVHSRKLPASYFQKKYDTAYTGHQYVGYMAYHQGTPIAYYGVIPCFLQNGDEIMLSAQSADTMTHPAYRFKGMFVELSKMTFDLCKELGILLIFGFPNENSYHGAVNKLGWRLINRMDCFMIPLNSIPFAHMLNKLPLLKKVYNRYSDYILQPVKRYKGIRGSVTSDGFTGLHRNDHYFHYKTYSRSVVVLIGETKVWLTNKGCLMIGDMEGVSGSNFDLVIHKLRNMAFKSGLKQIQFHCSPGTQLHSLFVSRFDPQPSYHALYQDFGSGIDPTTIRFTFSDIDIF